MRSFAARWSFQIALGTFLKGVQERPLHLVGNVKVEGALVACSNDCFIQKVQHYHISQASCRRDRHRAASGPRNFGLSTDARTGGDNLHLHAPDKQVPTSFRSSRHQGRWVLSHHVCHFSHLPKLGVSTKTGVRDGSVINDLHYRSHTVASIDRVRGVLSELCKKCNDEISGELSAVSQYGHHTQPARISTRISVLRAHEFFRRVAQDHLKRCVPHKNISSLYLAKHVRTRLPCCFFHNRALFHCPLFPLALPSDLVSLSLSLLPQSVDIFELRVCNAFTQTKFAGCSVLGTFTSVPEHPSFFGYFFFDQPNCASRTHSSEYTSTCGTCWPVKFSAWLCGAFQNCFWLALFEDVARSPGFLRNLHFTQSNEFFVSCYVRSFDNCLG